MLSQDDYQQVAQIHSQGIRDGFLSSLGDSFLALLYESIDRSENSVLVVAKEGGRVVGFVAGTVALGEVYRIMLRSWWRLFLAMIPALVSPKKIFKIFETLFFSSKSPAEYVNIPKAELLSIAVRQDCRGKGYAETLFQSLRDYFKASHQHSFKIVVGDALVPAHRFYKRMGALPVAAVEVHRGSGSTVYVCDV